MTDEYDELKDIDLDNIPEDNSENVPDDYGYENTIEDTSSQVVNVINRRTPHNDDAESCVIGSILIDNNVMDSCIGRINRDSFFDTLKGTIFQAMENVYKAHNKIELLNILDELKHLGQSDNNIERARDVIIQCADSIASTASAEVYINIVRDTKVERNLLSTMQSLSDDILNQKYSLNDTLDHVEDKIISIVRNRRTAEFIKMGDAAPAVYDKIKEYAGSNRELIGLDTGFEGLNKVTSGLQGGQMIILAARPSVGKSAYAMNIAMQCAKSVNNLDKQNKPFKANVALFSLEMNVDELLTRIYANMANVKFSNIRNGNLSQDDLMLLNLAKEEMNDINIYFDVNPSSNFSDIRLKCRQLHQKGTLDFIIIDYLQLIVTSDHKGARQEEVSQISRQLKNLAGELNVPILALSQLSRNIESRTGLDRRPQLSDLRESGSIEQDADIVMFLYRRSDIEDQEDTIADELNEKVKEATPQPKKSDDDDRMQEIVLSVMKNRQGALQDFDYHFYGQYFKFTEQPSFRPFIVKKKNNKSGMKDLKNNN